jgi:hypothetical protein
MLGINVKLLVLKRHHKANRKTEKGTGQVYIGYVRNKCKILRQFEKKTTRLCGVFLLLGNQKGRKRKRIKKMALPRVMSPQYRRAQRFERSTITTKYNRITNK